MTLTQLQNLLDQYNRATGNNAGIYIYGEGELVRIYLNYHNGSSVAFDTPQDLIDYLSSTVLVED